ncbi:MAG: ABC transporter permease [Atopobiaceae bacterium]|jgi:putative ABC transport system permease protein|nr:ABC transporter permease [Atopobiaceae bacterium]
MRARDLLYETWQALTANRGRSMLTILGIVIGIAAVISMTALIGGIQNTIVSSLGLNQSREIYISVSAGRSVTEGDLERIRLSVPGYELVTGTVSGTSTITQGKKSANASITGVDQGYFTTSSIKLAHGRFFSDAEMKAGGMVAIIDQNAVKDLFGDADVQVVGKTVKLGNDEYSIVGVSESSGFSMGSYETVYLPRKTATSRIIGSDASISQIIGYAKPNVDAEALAASTKTFLVSYFNVPADKADDEVTVMSMQSMVDQFNTVMSAFSLIMGAVAGISLLVGGIGIMNMMLTNVTERIREIGLRKALGARSADITRQFLLESIALCVCGGLLGILVGYLGAWGLALIVRAMRPSLASMSPAISPAAVLTAVGISVAIGVVFGYSPARRAARLDPVESLHYQ